MLHWCGRNVGFTLEKRPKSVHEPYSADLRLTPVQSVYLSWTTVAFRTPLKSSHYEWLLDSSRWVTETAGRICELGEVSVCIVLSDTRGAHAHSCMRPTSP